MATNKTPIYGNVVGGSGGGEMYNESYEVSPTVEGKTLITANKRMRDNLVIKGISYQAVENSSGGDTIYIANETE